MANVLFTNNAYSTLASSITDSDTTLTVATGEGARFPAADGTDYFYATLIDTSNNLEIIKVTNRSTDTFTITRGEDGTTAQAYSSSDRIELRPVAVALEEIRDSERTPIDDSVTTAKILDGAVTAAKLNSDVAAVASEIRDGSSGVYIDPAGLESAAAAVALSDAATIAVDWDTGINFTVTLTDNRALGFPTNVQAGTWRRLEVTQDGTGSRTLDFTATGYYTPNGVAPTLSTGAADVDVFFLYGRTTSIVEVYLGGFNLVQVT